MISKKLAAGAIFFGILLGLSLKNIYIPRDFEKPMLYASSFAANKLLAFFVK